MRIWIIRIAASQAIGFALLYGCGATEDGRPDAAEPTQDAATDSSDPGGSDCPSSCSSDDSHPEGCCGADDTSLDGDAGLRDVASDIAAIDGSGADARGCSPACEFGYTRSGECCDLTLLDFQTTEFFPSSEFQRLWGCPCDVVDFEAENARCSFDQDNDLVCNGYVWSVEHNGDGPDGDGQPCDDRIDWIVENTGWVSLERVADIERLRGIFESLQPCPDPYGGDL
jgi:hypothetical protein